MSVLDDILSQPARLQKRQDDQQLHAEQEQAANPFAGVKGLAAQACRMKLDNGEYVLESNFPKRLLAES